MLNEEQLAYYGIPEEAYKKTTQYQIDKLEKALHEFWLATGLREYFERVMKWISRKLSGCEK